MDWFYVDAGQQAGPVSDVQLEELLRSGKIQPETLIWSQGMANWEPYSKVKAPAASAGETATPGAASSMPSAPAVEPPKEAVCAQCGKIFPADDMIQHQGNFICAGCKPIFLQRLREGVGLSGLLTTGNLTEEQVLAREYHIDIGDALSQAWEILSKNFWPVVAAAVVVIITAFSGAMLSGVLAMFIPFANYLAGPLYLDPLLAGSMWFLLRLHRKEPATLSDAFSGFSGKFGQIVVFGLIYTGLSLLFMIPMIVMAFSFGMSFMITPGASAPSAFSFGLLGGIFVGMFIWWCGMAYVGTLFSYGLLLIMDKNYQFWPAIRLSRKMVSRRFWMTFLFLVVANIVGSLGSFALCIGVVASMPLLYGMRAVLYDKNFRDLKRQ